MEGSHTYSMNSDIVDTISMLSREITYVQEHIEKVNKTTEAQMHELEEKKRILKQTAGSGMPANLLEQSIEEMMVNHAHLFDEINKLSNDATKEKKSIDLINETITIMDREIAQKQADHDKGVIELRHKKEMLKSKLHSILDINVMMEEIEGKIAIDLANFNTELEEAQAAKIELLQRADMDPDQMEMELRRINSKIEKIQNKYLQDSEFMQKQKMDIEIESVAMMENLDKTAQDLFVGSIEDYTEELKRLYDLKLHASPSKQAGLDRAILFYESRIAEEKLKQNMSLKDKINEFLKLHGLTLFDSGEIVCADGKILTKVMARETRVLDALDKYLVESFGLKYIDMTRILTNDGRVLTRERAQNMGLMENYDIMNILFPDDSIRSDLSSRDSEFLSEDSFYLKKYLGVPLTLALAEITAKQPRDPIHYLAHWLFKYRYNQEIEQSKKLEVDQLTNMRNKIAQDKWTQFLEDEARRTVLEVVNRAQIEGDQREFDRDLQRIADETEEMENQEDEDALEEEARDTLGEYKGPTVNQRGATKPN